MIKSPTISQRTNYADINQFIDNTENYLTELATDLNTAFAELPQYSTEPQQIATWIDGSPVFRMAFDVLLKDMDATDYGELLSNGAFYVSTQIGSGGRASYPINAFCVYNYDYDSNTLLAHCPIKSVGEFDIKFAVPDDVTIPEDQSDCTDERYYGYIDFIQTGDAE